jgi:hypothetical protein
MLVASSVIESCGSTGGSLDDHFRDVTKMIENGKLPGDEND